MQKIKVNPKYSFATVVLIAKELNYGPKYWHRLAQFLKAACSHSHVKPEKFKELFGCDGGMKGLLKELELSKAKKTYLIAALNQVEKWDAELYAKAFADETVEFPAGYSVAYRAALCINSLQGEERISKEKELKEKFLNGTLGFSDCVIAREDGEGRKGKQNSHAFLSIIRTLEEQGITPDELNKILSEHMARRAKAFEVLVA